ncbi:MAG: hypothetical protein ACI93R_003827 [Flavobacteriales bacterium]
MKLLPLKHITLRHAELSLRDNKISVFEARNQKSDNQINELTKIFSKDNLVFGANENATIDCIYFRVNGGVFKKTFGSYQFLLPR